MIIYEDVEIFCRFNELLVICSIDTIDKQTNFLFQINNRRNYVLSHIFSDIFFYEEFDCK